MSSLVIGEIVFQIPSFQVLFSRFIHQELQKILELPETPSHLKSSQGTLSNDFVWSVHLQSVSVMSFI